MKALRLTCTSDGLDRCSTVGAIAQRYVYGAGPAPLVWQEGVGTSDERWLYADERGSAGAQPSVR